jgi:predicted MFS family arabinose efflux permease
MKAAGEAKAKAEAVEPLPSTLLPITLSVFAQMLGEGIAISSLPLYMTNLGASPMQVGLATSCFSAAQMVCCPLLVSLSSRVGRALVLRVCLIGATASSLLIAGSGSISGILLGRLFAGIFAASGVHPLPLCTLCAPLRASARLCARCARCARCACCARCALCTVHR